MRQLFLSTALFLALVLPASAQVGSFDKSSPGLSKEVRSAPVVQPQSGSALQNMGSDATHIKEQPTAPAQDATHLQEGSAGSAESVGTFTHDPAGLQKPDPRHGLSTGLKAGDLPKVAEGSGAAPTLSARDYGSDATALRDGEAKPDVKSGLAGARVVSQGAEEQAKPAAPDAKTGLATGLKPADLPRTDAAAQPEPDCPEGQVALPLQSGWRCTAPEQPCPEGKHPVRGMNGIECAAQDENAHSNPAHEVKDKP